MSLTTVKQHTTPIPSNEKIAIPKNIGKSVQPAKYGSVFGSFKSLARN